MDLLQLLENVNSKRTFLEFLRALADDAAEDDELEKESPPSWGPGPKGWENGSISTYLDAIARCVSAPANRSKFPEKADWKTFAKILLVGKSYE